MTDIRILVTDDRAEWLATVHDFLESEPGFRVIGSAASGEEAVRLTALEHPDVVVMDLEMPGISGLEATRRIRSGSPGVRVVGLSIHSGPEVRDAMCEAGAAGLVAKEEIYEELPLAIRRAVGGSNPGTLFR